MKKAVLGVLLGFGTLAYLIFHIGSRELLEALLQAELRWLVIGAALKVPVMWLKAKRWAIGIEEAIGRPVAAAFTASMIGFAGNLILPARLGEWARVSVIDKHNQTGRTLPLSALVVTQIFDLLLLVFGFLIAGSYVTERFFLNQHAAAVVLLLLGIGVLAALICLPKIVKVPSASPDLLLRRVPGRISRAIRPKISRCIQGVACLQRWVAVSRILALTILAWTIETGSVFTVLLAFRIEATPLMAAMLVILSNLSFLIPLTPGNIGVAQAVSIFVLAMFDVPGAPALAYGVTHQAIFYAVIIGLGLVCFYREGMSVKLFGGSRSGERQDGIAQAFRP